MKEYNININGHECTLPVDHAAFTFYELDGINPLQRLLDLAYYIGINDVQLQMELVGWLIRCVMHSDGIIGFKLDRIGHREHKWELHIKGKYSGIRISEVEHHMIMHYANNEMAE